MVKHVTERHTFELIFCDKYIRNIIKSSIVHIIKRTFANEGIRMSLITIKQRIIKTKYVI